MTLKKFIVLLSATAHLSSLMADERSETLENLLRAFERARPSIYKHVKLVLRHANTYDDETIEFYAQRSSSPELGYRVLSIVTEQVHPHELALLKKLNEPIITEVLLSNYDQQLESFLRHNNFDPAFNFFPHLINQLTFWEKARFIATFGMPLFGLLLAGDGLRDKDHLIGLITETIRTYFLEQLSQKT